MCNVPKSIRSPSFHQGLAGVGYTLLRLADSAMYVAKETGRNRTAVAGELVRRREL